MYILYQTKVFLFNASMYGSYCEMRLDRTSNQENCSLNSNFYLKIPSFEHQKLERTIHSLIIFLSLKHSAFTTSFPHPYHHPSHESVSEVNATTAVVVISSIKLEWKEKRTLGMVNERYYMPSHILPGKWWHIPTLCKYSDTHILV